jgi:hypothetical protein
MTTTPSCREYIECGRNQGHQHRPILGKHEDASMPFDRRNVIEYLRGGLGNWRPGIEGGVDGNFGSGALTVASAFR